MSTRGDPRPLRPGLTLRNFASRSDFEQGFTLQRLTWGEGFTECVPVTIMQITQQVGGIAAGAFDADDRLVGFVYGVSGERAGRPAHWSHMLAVLPEFRAAGLGTRLKSFQRDLLLAAGIDVAYWTYDPLVSGNAHLNINRLAAYPVEYVADMYGSNTGSDLHSGLGTDRFVVKWELSAAQVAQAMEGGPSAKAAPPTDAPVVGLEYGQPGGDPPSLPAVPMVLIEIPIDIQEVKRTGGGVDDAFGWRRATRRAFEWYLGRDYTVAGFWPDHSVGRAYYIVTDTNEQTDP